MSLSLLERETIISFNEEEKTADIQTYNGALKRKMSTLCEARPDEAKYKRTDEYGGMYFTVPKKWIKVNATRIPSEKQLATLSEMRKRLKNQF